MLAFAERYVREACLYSLVFAVLARLPPESKRVRKRRRKEDGGALLHGFYAEEFPLWTD